MYILAPRCFQANPSETLPPEAEDLGRQRGADACLVHRLARENQAYRGDLNAQTFPLEMWTESCAERASRL
jgi:hypothetical protein